MIVTLKTQGLQTLEDIRAFLEGTQALGFEAPARRSSGQNPDRRAPQAPTGGPPRLPARRFVHQGDLPHQPRDEVTQFQFVGSVGSCARLIAPARSCLSTMLATRFSGFLARCLVSQPWRSNKYGPLQPRREAPGKLLPARRDRRAPQYLLYFLPLPQGQGSLRPILILRTGMCSCCSISPVNSVMPSGSDTAMSSSSARRSGTSHASDESRCQFPMVPEDVVAAGLEPRPLFTPNQTMVKDQRMSFPV